MHGVEKTHGIHTANLSIHERSNKNYSCKYHDPHSHWDKFGPGILVQSCQFCKRTYLRYMCLRCFYNQVDSGLEWHMLCRSILENSCKLLRYMSHVQNSCLYMPTMNPQTSLARSSDVMNNHDQPKAFHSCNSPQSHMCHVQNILADIELPN